MVGFDEAPAACGVCATTAGGVAEAFVVAVFPRVGWLDSLVGFTEACKQ